MVGQFDRQIIACTKLPVQNHLDTDQHHQKRFCKRKSS